MGVVEPGWGPLGRSECSFSNPSTEVWKYCWPEFGIGYIFTWKNASRHKTTVPQGIGTEPEPRPMVM